MLIKKLSRRGLLLSLVVLLVACAPMQPLNGTVASKTSLRDTHERLHGTLFMQTAAEHQVLCRIMYTQARNSMDAALADSSWTAALEQEKGFEILPPAVVVDIDETVLDNSRFQGRLTNDRSEYNEATWKEWVAKQAATVVPGAAEFLTYVASKGVAVFYITNRDATQEADTRSNLRNENLPVLQSPDVVLMKGENGWTSSDKKARRQVVAKEYRIVLIVGDDLGDFVTGAKDSPRNRVALANSYANMWGTKWVLIPNALYGSWESALYGHDFALPDNEVLQKKFSAIQGF
jgi:5'-nucleotidase (lipoprotein e(P4) family)